MQNCWNEDSAMTSRRLVSYHKAISLPVFNKGQIVSTDDYMPMPINNLDEYDKVVSVSWFTPDKPREELTYVYLNVEP